MSVREDDQLLALIAGGDQVALAELYDRHAGWLWLRLSRLCPDLGLVEEIVQDTFVSVWRSASAYRPAEGGAGAGGWLWTVASRRLVDGLRRGERTAEPSDAVPSETAAGPEEVLLTDLSHGDLAGALDRLSPDLRRVLQATVVDGFTTREASVVLGIPEGTVKTRAARARRQLRAGLA